jgi:hypothetical protein
MLLRRYRNGGISRRIFSPETQLRGQERFSAVWGRIFEGRDVSARSWHESAGPETYLRGPRTYLRAPGTDLHG